LGQFQESVDFLTKAIDLDSESAVYHHERGKCYLQIDDFEKALKDLNFTISNQPNNANALYARGFAYKVYSHNLISF